MVIKGWGARDPDGQRNNNSISGNKTTQYVKLYNLLLIKMMISLLLHEKYDISKKKIRVRSSQDLKRVIVSHRWARIIAAQKLILAQK